MEKMSIVFLIIIIVYLGYSFIQSRREKEKGKNFTEKENTFSTAPSLEEGEANNYEAAAVTAVIAAIMGDAAYRIKRVYVTANVDEKKSSWKLSGRNESMMRRVFFK